MSQPEYINIAMMPLRKNIPSTSNEDWQLTTCPECGRECWRMGKMQTSLKVCVLAHGFFARNVL